jgi:hypothetical protein
VQPLLPALFWLLPAEGMRMKSCLARGRQKKIDGPPRAFAKSQTHPPSGFVFLDLFLVHFWAFLDKNIFTKKSMSKTFSKISTKNSMSVFPRLFLFYRVFGCFSAMAVQKHYKKRFTKEIVSKSFYKKFDKTSKTDFLSIFFFSRFWAFLDEGSSKTR